MRETRSVTEGELYTTGEILDVLLVLYKWSVAWERHAKMNKYRQRKEAIRHIVLLAN